MCLTGNFFSLWTEEFQAVTAVFNAVQTGLTADGGFAAVIGSTCDKQVDITVGNHATDVAVILFFTGIDSVLQAAAVVVAVRRDIRILVAVLFGQIAVCYFIALGFTDDKCACIEVLQLACVIGFLSGVAHGNRGTILSIRLEVAYF